MANKKECNMKLCSITTIWPKWQVVIPKDVREKLNLKQWDSVSILLKDDKYIWIVRNVDVKELMEYISNIEN